MKKIQYKNKALTLFLGVSILCVSQVYASEVTGTMSTGLGNSSVSGVVVSAPSASLSAGTYTGAQSVTLASNGSLSIRYTVNGVDPTCSTGSVYTTAISISSSQTVKAIACYANSVSSPVSSYTYSISQASSGGSSGGGGGGYYSAPYVPVTATTTATTTVSANTPVILGTVSVNPSIKGQVLGASAYTFSKDLKMGNKNNDVKELQKILIAEGFLKSEVTGFFGVLTRTALINWQAKNKIAKTGILDKASRALLSPSLIVSSKPAVLGVTTYAFTMDLKLGSKGTDVSELQKMLIAEGLLNSEVTGYFGVMTKASLVKWQAKNGLPATGFFGSMSRNLLNKK